MTITMTDPMIPAQREPGHDQTVTPESQDLAKLQTMLGNPDLAGFHEEIGEAIRRLTATSVLGA